MSIELFDIARDELTGQRWLFQVMTIGGGTSARIAIRLDEWEPLERKTKRHKWIRSGMGYHRRSSDFHHPGYTKPAAEVPFPDEIKSRLFLELQRRVDLTGPEDPMPRGKWE